MENNSAKKAVCRYYITHGECFYENDCQFSHEDHGQTLNLNSMEKSENTKTICNISSQIPSESKLSSYLNDLKIDNNFTKTINTDEKSSVLTKNVNSTLDQNTFNKRPNLNNTNLNTTMNEDVKLDTLKKNDFFSNLNESENSCTDIPSQLGSYINLQLLEEPNTTSTSKFNLITTNYKATNIKTGQAVCLRRINLYISVKNIFHKSLMQKIKDWKSIVHTNIIKLHEVFLCKDFGDNSLIFVYDYYPGAKSLMTQYFSNSSSTNKSLTTTNVNRPYSQQQQAQREKLLPEQLIWSYLFQLISIVRTVFNKGLTCRNINLKKILIISKFPGANATNQNNQIIKLNCCFITDVLENNLDKDKINICGHKTFSKNLQIYDLRSIGLVISSLLINSPEELSQQSLLHNLNSSSCYYSDDLIMVVFNLLTYKDQNEENSKSSIKFLESLLPIIGLRFYDHIDFCHQKIDKLEDELSKEMNNSRLFRLLAKLGCINERPELGVNEKWSETGDRYLLKLFRDFIFHQNKEDGLPFIDLGHIITTLNKLDAGSKEKICLTSRDGQNMIIVSFAELKKCCDSSFQQLFCNFITNKNMERK